MGAIALADIGLPGKDGVKKAANHQDSSGLRGWHRMG
jgi:hypothetical protein